MEQQNTFFSNYKFCEGCQRPLPLRYSDPFCPDCQEENLFREVKEYIRANDVNEYDVCAEFHLPRSRVHRWIREGRIEYKDKRLNEIQGQYCVQCGVPISFGTLCPKCLKQAGAARHTSEPVAVSDKPFYFT
jgi:hypothetical protein